MASKKYESNTRNDYTSDYERSMRKAQSAVNTARKTTSSRKEYLVDNSARSAAESRLRAAQRPSTSSRKEYLADNSFRSAAKSLNSPEARMQTRANQGKFRSAMLERRLSGMMSGR